MRGFQIRTNITKECTKFLTQLNLYEVRYCLFLCRFSVGCGQSVRSVGLAFDISSVYFGTNVSTMFFRLNFVLGFFHMCWLHCFFVYFLAKLLILLPCNNESYLLQIPKKWLVSLLLRMENFKTFIRNNSNTRTEHARTMWVSKYKSCV